MNRKKLSLTLFPVLSLLALVFSAQLAFAQQPTCTPTPETVNGVTVQKYNCTFVNPITTQTSIIQLLKSVFAQIRPFAISIIVLIIIYIGFRIVAASATSNPGELSKWKKALILALFAAAIVGGSGIILDAIEQFSKGIQ